jgi:hypothetical protein
VAIANSSVQAGDSRRASAHYYPGLTCYDLGWRLDAARELERAVSLQTGVADDCGAAELRGLGRSIPGHGHLHFLGIEGAFNGRKYAGRQAFERRLPPPRLRRAIRAERLPAQPSSDPLTSAGYSVLARNIT